jgi:hypothetical protein
VAQQIKLKRSAVSGKVPLTTDVALGELALNTTDGKMYYKKNVSGVESMIQVARVVPVTVATAAATAAKTGTTADTTYTPISGDFIVVTFTNGNSVATATLSINGSTAQNLRLNNSNVNTSTFSLVAGAVVTFYYDGSIYHCMGSQDTSDDYDIYSLRTYNIQVGAQTTRYKFLMQGTDGKFYPISIGDTTATTKTVATTEFLVNSKIIHYYTTATLAADGVSTIFYNEGLCETRYAFNQTTWTLNRPVYLVGTINSNGNFVLNNSSLTSYFTQTLPTSDDGKVYVFVGIPYANTALKLYTDNPMYEYKDGKIRQYIPSHTHSASDITSGTINTARLGSGTANSTTFLRGDNTWVTAGGTGTVTSVALSGGTTGLTVTGSPITTSGTLTLGGTLANSATTATSANTASAIVARDGSGNFSAGFVTLVNSNVDANNVNSLGLQLNAPWMVIGDRGAGQTYTNGIGIKFHDAGVAHYSLGQINGNFVIAHTSSSGEALFPSGTSSSGIMLTSGGNVAIGKTSASTALDVNGTVTATAFSGPLTGAVTGNASTATTLATGRTIGMTGDVTWTSASFNGSGNVTGTATLANSGATAGTYRSVTVDAKGRVTAGTNPTTLSGYGITDALSNSTSSTQNAYFGDIHLQDDTTPSHYLKITDTDNLTANRTLNLTVNNADRNLSLSGNLTVSGNATVSGTNTGDQTITLTGDVTGSGTGSFATTLAASGVTAGTYTKVTVDAKGRTTSGTTLSATDIPNLDAAKITSGVLDAARLPSFVDDVLEYANLASFPGTGETGKIYVALDTNKTYRWSGSAYIYITSGAVDSVAGKTGVVTLVKGDVGLGNVDNTADSAKNVATAATWTTARTVSLGGDLSGSASVNGSANVTITATIGANTVTDADLRDSAALSVIGRSANSSGDPADIAAGTDGHVLRRSGTTLGFGTVATAGIADAAITAAKLNGAQTGSAAVFGARAWVNFKGQGTISIRSSGNVSSVSDNGVGLYTVNFSTAMPNNDYSVIITPQASASTSSDAGGTAIGFIRPGTDTTVMTTSAVQIKTAYTYVGIGVPAANLDSAIICVAIIG